MKNSISWTEMENLLIRLGDELKNPTSLCILGSAVSMSLGQVNRMTMDIDVWREDSSYDLGALKQACALVGIAFDPKGYDDPDTVYIQIIDPGIVQLGVFEKTSLLFKTGNLEICRPPIANVIASKMVRGVALDFEDSSFLAKKCNVSIESIEKSIISMNDKVSSQNAMANLEVLKLYLSADSASPTIQKAT